MPTVAFKMVLKAFQFRNLKKSLTFLNCISWLSFTHAERPEMAASFARNACRDHLAEQRTSERTSVALECTHPHRDPGMSTVHHCEPLDAAAMHWAPPRIWRLRCVLTLRGIKTNSISWYLGTAFTAGLKSYRLYLWESLK